MLTFQSIMFVLLGFLCAVLLGFIVAPAFWARAVRLTTERLRATLPLTEAEIRAERDRLRAENAIRVHQLTSRIERARLSDARQRVEIERRDASISSLERRVNAAEAELEASQNACRVLEDNLHERVPEIEQRLIEAGKLLAERDAEINALRNDSATSLRALEEAMQINVQQRAEVELLQSAAAGRRSNAQSARTTGESEEALRAELDRLQVRTREQAALIKRLEGGGRVAPSPADEPDSGAESARLKATLDEQAAAIAGLQAELAVFEREAAGKGPAAHDSRTALEARIAAHERELEARSLTIAKLRKELAEANERIAKQASYYTDELRRLGASPPPAELSGPPHTAPSSAPAASGERIALKSAKGGLGALLDDMEKPRDEPAGVEAEGTSGWPRPADAGEAASLPGNGKSAAPSGNGRSNGASEAGQKAETPKVSLSGQAEGDDDHGSIPRRKLMERIAGLAKR